jgi:murein DD-endopeptidase MepM/ murein hydrolase activator NlpD
MRIVSLLCITFVLSAVFFFTESLAQAKKKTGDFNQIQVPKIDYKAPVKEESDLNRSTISEIQPVPDNTRSNESYINNVQELKRELALVSEDTLDIELHEEDFLVEVNEALQIDSMWVTLQEYYAIWSTNAVNPYKIDGSKFNDNVTLTLYDTLSGLHWYPPLADTYITSNFGMRRTRWHYGIDLKLQIGDSVKTVFDGIVRIVKNDPRGYGNYVLIRHINGLETLYGHLSAQLVQVGQIVKAGELIGLGGNTGRSTGPHLHFEVRYQGNAINPTELYDFNKNMLLVQQLNVSPKTFSYLKEVRKQIYHQVVRGDTLYKISRKYGVPVATIAKMNKMSTQSTLRVGQKLRVR